MYEHMRVNVYICTPASTDRAATGWYAGTSCPAVCTVINEKLPFIYIYIYMYIYMCIYINLHVNIYMYTYIYIYVYTYTYLIMYTLNLVRNPPCCFCWCLDSPWSINTGKYVYIFKYRHVNMYRCMQWWLKKFI
jgi:hypothetical protein